MSPTEPNDLSPLIDGCIAQRRDCQQQLYQRFYGYGMSICLRYTPSGEEAVEVLNDGFMKVYQKLSDFRRDQSFRAWFRRILINTAINHYHRTKKHHHHDPIETQIEQSADTPDAISQLSYEELYGVVQQLPPVYRTVFNLYAIEGYHHEEIARALDISVGTSKSNLSRARAQLRTMLKKNEKPLCQA